MKTILCAASLLVAMAVPASAFYPIPGDLTYPAPSAAKPAKPGLGRTALDMHGYSGRRLRDIDRAGPDRKAKLRSRSSLER